MRVLIAPDKFKGSLSAPEAAGAIMAGLRPFPGIIPDACPLADGGEGFSQALGARQEPLDGIRNPLGRPVTAHCGWLGNETAVIEISDASGIHRLSPAERDPWNASTFGTGQIILHAASRGASRILVGLGGSATNDAGAGAAAALGWEFLTSDGEPIEPRPANFLAIERIEAPETLALPEIVAACDVSNPLLGPEGASRIYAAQKGADSRMIEYLEMALAHLAELIADQLGIDNRLLPGAGAAGGFGYGLATFCSARIESGFSIVARALDLEARIAACDLVITGEGRVDAQSLRGKAPVSIARLARKHGKPVALVCGACEPGASAEEWFDFILPLESLEPSPPLCIANAGILVERAAGRIAEWAIGRNPASSSVLSKE